MPIQIIINGQNRVFTDAASVATVAGLVATLELKVDRVAVELNGELAPRTTWAETEMSDGDRVELVHFVGGGSNIESGRLINDLCDKVGHA